MTRFRKHASDIDDSLTTLLAMRYSERVWMIQVALAKRLRLRVGTREAELSFPALETSR